MNLKNVVRELGTILRELAVSSDTSDYGLCPANGGNGAGTPWTESDFDDDWFEHLHAPARRAVAVRGGGAGLMAC